MRVQRRNTRAWWLGACAWICMLSERGFACAVCYGDPESPMAKGVVAGVAVLMAVVGTVLFAVAGTGLYWIQRSRRMSQGLCPGHATTSETSGDLGES